MQVDVLFGFLIPLCLILLMFGMGLGLKVDEFRLLIKQRRPLLIGIMGQLILLPVVGFLIVTNMPMRPEIGLGIIILSSVPGGVSSNVLVYSVRGDVALSVSLTAINTLFSVITIPLILSYGLDLFPGYSDKLSFELLSLVGKLLVLCILPVALGMVCGRASIRHFDLIENILRKISSVVIYILLIMVVTSEWDFILANIGKSWLPIVSLNITCMILTLVLCQLLKIARVQKITLAIEVGLQNSALALLIATSVVDTMELTVAPTLYGAICYALVTLFAMMASRYWIGRPQLDI